MFVWENKVFCHTSWLSFTIKHHPRKSPLWEKIKVRFHFRLSVWESSKKQESEASDFEALTAPRSAWVREPDKTGKSGKAGSSVLNTPLQETNLKLTSQGQSICLWEKNKQASQSDSTDFYFQIWQFPWKVIF